jgi:hypothetical protein
MNPGLRSLFGRGVVAVVVTLACACPEHAQDPVETAQAPAPARYSAPQLDQLLGPIALYPDELVALILPAATSPGDLVSAASYVDAKADPYDAGSQPWSESVKALVHYPEIVDWMAQNLTWVQAVGAAFATEPEEVMQSIQRLRSRAQALGSLVNTPQQEVVTEDGLIEILPVDSDVIYVPRYDPSVVFVIGPEPDQGAFISFGIPYHAGDWLNYGFDWRRQALVVGRFYRDGQGWQRPNLLNQSAHAWHPRTQPSFPPAGASRPWESPVRPSLLPGAPPMRPSAAQRWGGYSGQPDFNQAAVPPGQRLYYPGAVPAGLPGNPAAAEWQRERVAREREDNQRAAVRPGGSTPAPAHPPTPPPKPATPPTSPPANGQRDRDQDRN